MRIIILVGFLSPHMNVFSIKIKFPDTHGALIVVPATRAICLTAIPLW